MNGYLKLELENGNQLAIIDIIELNNKKYFYIKNLNNLEYEICIYNCKNNYLDEIENFEEYNNIKRIFEERIVEKVCLGNKLEYEIFSNLIPLKIISIDGYNYSLEYEGRVIKKNIDFYIKRKPKVNDIIYMSENIIKEVNLFQFGKIYNLNKINEDEIIKLVCNNEEYYLQRYYG